MAIGLQYTVWEAANMVPQGAKLNQDVIAVGGASTQSSDVIDPTGENRIRYVRLFADADCFVEWGADPTAAIDGQNGIALGSENPEYHWIRANEKIAVIART